MRRLIATALVLVALVGIWWLTRNGLSPEAPPPEGDVQVERTAPAPAEPPSPPPPAESPAEPAFRERLRTFVAGAAMLSEAERAAQAESLRRETLAREAQGTLLPAESAYIQLALLRATISDEAEWRRRSEALLERYQAASEQGWEEYRRRIAPQHEAYRAAEAELIRRARERGISDDELRERLQALREEHYQ